MQTIVFLALAIVFEVGWAIAMKLSDGFTKLWPTVATIVMYLLSVVFLALATKKMEIGTAYAIWAGSGVALICIAGIVHFQEPLTTIKIVSILLIVTGIIGLNLAGGAH
jgi:multidrug transporter EmrE-like cation transporter